jgi:hypothetical protein
MTSQYYLLIIELIILLVIGRAVPRERIISKWKTETTCWTGKMIINQFLTLTIFLVLLRLLHKN